MFWRSKKCRSDEWEPKLPAKFSIKVEAADGNIFQQDFTIESSTKPIRVSMRNIMRGLIK